MVARRGIQRCRNVFIIIIIMFGIEMSDVLIVVPVMCMFGTQWQVLGIIVDDVCSRCLVLGNVVYYCG